MKKFTPNSAEKQGRKALRIRFMALFGLMFLFVAGMSLDAVAQKGNNMPTPVQKSCSLQRGNSQVNFTLKGQLPSKAKVQATPVQRTFSQDKQVKGAYDITIKNGKSEWQPQAGQPVMVTIADANFTDGEFMDVYHENGDVLEFVATVSPENGQITFPARSFSVYIVAESEVTQRLKVNFVQADGTTISLYVKPRDLQDENLYKAIVYDPGVGTLGENIQFRGWTKIQNYTATTPNWTIDDVRNDIRDILNTGVTDGQQVTYYSILFRSYQVAYLDEHDLVCGLHDVSDRADAGANLSYTVNQAYDPESTEHTFLGWSVSDGGDHIQGYTSDHIYTNGTPITINGNVVFSVNAPIGHWLIFKSNGDGASYVNAQFIASGHTTTTPTAPTRYGYTFAGWFTDEACTQAFTFGNEITSNTTVYAKWNAASSASYTVIIWKQNLAGNGYDYAESVTLSGTPGNTINTVTATGSGDDRRAVVNNTPKQYTGFHLNQYDENVTIKPEGTTVLNVYYDRNEVTLTFQVQSGYSWTTQETMTGLYGQTLASRGYTWPTNRWWYDSPNNTNNRTTFLDAFILPDGSSEETFYGRTGTGSNQVHFYKQNADGNGYTEANTMTTGNGTFYITDKYNGFKAVQYSRNNTSWTNLGNPDGQGEYASVSNYTNLYIRFDRINYPILFSDGKYVNDDGNPTGQEGRGELKAVYNVRYGANVSSYNKGGADYYVPTYEGYVFAGWYKDESCTEPYTFTEMPDGGITVFAKWQQIQYRVFLHPNAGDATSSPTLTWNGGTEQEMNFRVDYQGTVQAPTGSRQGYHFIGWFRDEDLTLPFNDDAFTLNETTVTTPYDNTVDMTDPMDIWGNGATYNKDAQNDRFWINKKYDLYAKWTVVMEGADGINLAYDCAGGTTCPSDNKTYLEGVTALAASAPGNAPLAPNNKPQRFAYWVVQHWDATANNGAGAFVDGNVHVFPGEEFTVNGADARQTPLEEGGEVVPGRYTYTVQLRAEYVLAEEPTPTHITWFRNDGTTGDAAIHHDYADISINDAVAIPAAPTRTGYTFLGWYKYRVIDGLNVPSNLPADASGSSQPNFLYYNAANQTYYKSSSFTEGNEAQYVAADEANPYDYLYAIWRADGYVVRFNKNADAAEGTMQDQAFEMNVAQNLTANAFTYENHCFQGWATEATSTTVAYADGASYNNTTAQSGDVFDLYAVWQEKVTPTFDNLKDVYCVGEEAVTLPTTSDNDLAGSWEPATINTSAATTDPVTYTFTPDADCSNTFTFDVTVNPSPTLDVTPAEQTVSNGEPIEDVVVTYTNSTISYTELPDGITYDGTTHKFSGTPTSLGEYTVTVTANVPEGSSCEPIEKTFKIVVNSMNLTIKLDSTKVYDGKTFDVTYQQLHISGLLDGDKFVAGKLTTVSDDPNVELSGIHVGEYKTTEGFTFAPMAVVGSVVKAENFKIENAAGEDVTASYVPAFDVTLEITKRPITIASATETRPYNGEPLTNHTVEVTSDETPAIAATDQLADGTPTVTGSQLCLGTSDNTMLEDAAIMQGDVDVTADYDITYETGTLTVTEMDPADFVCSEPVDVLLKDCEVERVVTNEDLGEPTINLTGTEYVLTNNLDELNPMTFGTYTVVWTLNAGQDCEEPVATCEQEVTIAYTPCGTMELGGYTYQTVRIGSQCWITENLRYETPTAVAYKEDDANVEKFGYLYTWYTAVGVDEDDDTAVPETKTDDCGNEYVQGICPDNWGVGSQADYDLLNSNAAVNLLKDPSTQYWQTGYEGDAEGNTGFSARGSGMYNSVKDRYEDLMTNYHFWNADSTPGSTVNSEMISYYCDHIQTIMTRKSDKMSVRCVRKITPEQ